MFNQRCILDIFCDSSRRCGAPERGLAFVAALLPRVAAAATWRGIGDAWLSLPKRLAAMVRILRLLDALLLSFATALSAGKRRRKQAPMRRQLGGMRRMILPSLVMAARVVAEAERVAQRVAQRAAMEQAKLAAAAALEAGSRSRSSSSSSSAATKSPRAAKAAADTASTAVAFKTTTHGVLLDVVLRTTARAAALVERPFGPPKQMRAGTSERQSEWICRAFSPRGYADVVSVALVALGADADADADANASATTAAGAGERDVSSAFTSGALTGGQRTFSEKFPNVLRTPVNRRFTSGALATLVMRHLSQVFLCHFDITAHIAALPDAATWTEPDSDDALLEASAAPSHRAALRRLHRCVRAHAHASFERAAAVSLKASEEAKVELRVAASDALTVFLSIACVDEGADATHLTQLMANLVTDKRGRRAVLYARDGQLLRVCINALSLGGAVAVEDIAAGGVDSSFGEGGKRGQKRKGKKPKTIDLPPGWTVARTTRKTGQRDREITAPNGRKFRSFKAAQNAIEADKGSAPDERFRKKAKVKAAAAVAAAAAAAVPAAAPTAATAPAAVEAAAAAAAAAAAVAASGAGGEGEREARAVTSASNHVLNGTRPAEDCVVALDQAAAAGASRALVAVEKMQPLQTSQSGALVAIVGGDGAAGKHAGKADDAESDSSSSSSSSEEELDDDDEESTAEDDSDAKWQHDALRNAEAGLFDREVLLAACYYLLFDITFAPCSSVAELERKNADADADATLHAPEGAAARMSRFDAARLWENVVRLGWDNSNKVQIRSLLERMSEIFSIPDPPRWVCALCALANDGGLGGHSGSAALGGAPAALVATAAAAETTSTNVIELLERLLPPPSIITSIVRKCAAPQPPPRVIGAGGGESEKNENGAEKDAEDDSMDDEEEEEEADELRPPKARSGIEIVERRIRQNLYFTMSNLTRAPSARKHDSFTRNEGEFRKRIRIIAADLTLNPRRIESWLRLASMILFLADLHYDKGESHVDVDENEDGAESENDGSDVSGAALFAAAATNKPSWLVAERYECAARRCLQIVLRLLEGEGEAAMAASVATARLAQQVALRMAQVAAIAARNRVITAQQRFRDAQFLAQTTATNISSLLVLQGQLLPAVFQQLHGAHMRRLQLEHEAVQDAEREMAIAQHAEATLLPPSTGPTDAMREVARRHSKRLASEVLCFEQIGATMMGQLQRECRRGSADLTRRKWRCEVARRAFEGALECVRRRAVLAHTATSAGEKSSAWFYHLCLGKLVEKADPMQLQSRSGFVSNTTSRLEETARVMRPHLPPAALGAALRHYATALEVANASAAGTGASSVPVAAPWRLEPRSGSDGNTSPVHAFYRLHATRIKTLVRWWCVHDTTPAGGAADAARAKAKADAILTVLEAFTYPSVVPGAQPQGPRSLKDRAQAVYKSCVAALERCYLRSDDWIKHRPTYRLAWALHFGGAMLDNDAVVPKWSLGTLAQAGSPTNALLKKNAKFILYALFSRKPRLSQIAAVWIRGKAPNSMFDAGDQRYHKWNAMRNK